MIANIENFLENGLALNGARANRFNIVATLPQLLALNQNYGETIKTARKLTFTCHATSIPAMKIGTVNAPYFGRYIKLDGDRIWDDWNIKVFVDADYSTRNMFEAWSNFMNQVENNTTLAGPLNGSMQSYKGTFDVYQFDMLDNVIAQYTIIGAWPNEIGQMDLSWDKNNTVSEFDVRISFDNCISQYLSNTTNQYVSPVGNLTSYTIVTA